MKVGIAIPHYSAPGDRETIVQTVTEAERLGFDSVFTTDHVMMATGQDEPYGHIYEALVTLSYAAALTSRVDLGVSVIVLPQRNPILVAKQVATLDALSGGRVILGLGAGWNQREFEFLDASFDDRGKRLEEYIPAMQALWRSTTPAFDGKYVRFGDALFSPPPARAGGPPIWLGGHSRPAIRRTATLCDGWHPVGVTVQEFADGMAAIKAQAGGRNIEGTIRLRVAVGRECPETRRATGEIVSTVGGSPEQVAETLNAYQAVGVDHLVAVFGDNTRESFLADMRAFADKVRPRLL
jgi:probable F420-dependent oxidoreductase